MTAALMQAASKGNLDVVLQFIAKGTDMNAKDENGKTALMYALKHGHADVVRVLLKGGVVNTTGNYGMNASNYAVKNWYADIA